MKFGDSNDMKLFWRAPLILMLVFATGNLVSPSATAYGITHYILSGGKSISDPIHVDDDLQILLSDKVIFSNNDGRANDFLSPIEFRASAGDRVRIIAKNVFYYGTNCIGLSPLYLHIPHSQIIQVLDPQGVSQPCSSEIKGGVFYDRTFAINIPSPPISSGKESLLKLVPKNPGGPPYTFLLTYKGYKERTESHVITDVHFLDVHFLNVTGAWFEITREGTIESSVIPYAFLMGPKGNEPLSERIFKDIRFEKGQYLKLTAKRTTVAAYCALALDLIGRGLFGVTMPENILDGTHPLITELFTTIKSNHAGELGAFGYAITTKDYDGAIKHLAKFIISTKKSKEVMLKLIREVFGPENSVRYASFLSKNLVDIVFAFKPVKLLTEITYWTFKAPTEGYARLEAIGQLPIKEPHYTREKAQKEAKQVLASIRTLEEAYKAENNTYSKSLLEEIKLEGVRDYNYSILKASKDHFLAEAMGITALTKGDRWAIDHEGKIFHGTEIDERVSKLEEIEKNREQKRTEELEKKRRKRIYDYVKKIWGSQDPQIYYPLKEGMTWEYQLSTSSKHIEGTTKVVVTNFAPRELKGKKVTPQKTDVGGQSFFSFIAEDEDGIYEFAVQPPEAVEPQILSWIYYIKYPVQMGTTWEGRIETSLLINKLTDRRVKVSVGLKSIIESIDDVVTVPAGTFNKCVKVKSVGSAKENAASINVEDYNWYAPGVGRIKSIFKEMSDHFMIASGEQTMQLESFKK